MEAAFHAGRQLGLATGFNAFDRVSGGLYSGELTVLAARTGVGKSAFAMEIACRAAENGSRVLIASLEMDQFNQGQRLLARHTSIPISRMRTGRLEEGDFSKLKQASQAEPAGCLNLLITRRATIEKIRSIAKMHTAKRGLDLLIVDHIGIIRKRDNRTDQRAHVTEVTRELKSLAMEIQKPILALSQINRLGEGTEPTLDQLRDSGSVEEDADFVWLLHGERGEKDYVLNVAKGRQGRTGKVNFKFDSGKMHWSEPPVSIVNTY